MAGFSYDVHDDEAAEAFFAFLSRAGVEDARIERMKETRREFLSDEANEELGPPVEFEDGTTAGFRHDGIHNPHDR